MHTSSPWITFAIQFTSTVMVLVFVCSLIFCFRKANPRYLRSLPVYLLADCSSMLYTKGFPDKEYISYYLFSVFEICYFTFFFTQVYEKKKPKFYIRLFCSVSVLGSLAVFLRGLDAISISISLLLLVYCECFLFIVGSLYYLRTLASSTHIVMIYREPSFWMVVGILFYFVVLVPTMGFTLIAYGNHHADLGQAMYMTNDFAEVVMFILFIIAMVCRPRK